MRRPVMIYAGGKFKVRDWVIEHLPEHEIYVEPFGGAASVLMGKPRAHREIYNDLNSEIVNVFKVLRDPKLARTLEHQIKLTPFSREEMKAAKLPDPDPLEQARRTIVSAFMCRSRQEGDGSGMRYSKVANSPKEKDWATYADHMHEFTERLRGVLIENKPATEVIADWDGPKTLFYCDPPYIHESRKDRRLYKHEMSDAAHELLLSVLRDLKGMVVLSGYDSEVYAKHLVGWSKVHKETNTSTHRRVTEVLWINPAAIQNSKQMNLFDSGLR